MQRFPVTESRGGKERRQVLVREQKDGWRGSGKLLSLPDPQLSLPKANPFQHLRLSSIIYRSQKVEITLLSISWWINNIYPYSGIITWKQKRMTYWYMLTAWVNLENIMLSERSQLTKGHILPDTVHREMSNGQIHRDRKQTHSSQGPWGGENAKGVLICRRLLHRVIKTP